MREVKTDSDDETIAGWFTSLSPRNSTHSLLSLLAKEELSRTESEGTYGDANGGEDVSNGDVSEVSDWESDSDMFFDVELSKESDTGFINQYSSRDRPIRRSDSLFEGDASSVTVLQGALMVVLQFAWWRIKSASIGTWGPLFAPDPSTVARRLFKSIIPITLRGSDYDCRSSASDGHSHGPTSTSLAILTSNPDLFVPTMLVLSLAQVTIPNINLFLSIYMIITFTFFFNIHY